MKFCYFCLIFAACFAVSYSRDIYVNSTTELQNAMKMLLPGDKVVVSPGKYQIHTQTYSAWNIKAAGTSEKPISLSCAVDGLCDLRDSIVLSSSSYFTISGFTVGTSYTYDAITVQDCDHITLNSLNIHDGDDDNLWVLRSSYCTIKSCTFGTSQKAIFFQQGSDSTVSQCTFGKGISDNVLYIDNCTNVEFSSNEVYGSKGSYSAGSWIVENDAGGNLIADNDFGFGFMKYQIPLNGYLAKGTCLYGPTTLKNNYMDLKSGTGFAGCKDYKNRVCASNVVAGGATFTDGDIDNTC